ncbi:hypothetical protein EDB81DRAFT_885699 [Dactylonectria macrodidyma]|uniref:Uncharacterized protein n=1 Tax=Dactylonectria macrodidyma TaxID=307937 RepID=A0A9P9EP30_9HYPO|nr:hypothetical protein EDB81DRAFT_885699 [Dactylonectria macrodidyma]
MRSAVPLDTKPSRTGLGTFFRSTVMVQLPVWPMQLSDKLYESHLVIKLIVDDNFPEYAIELLGTPILKDMPPALWGEKTNTPDAAVNQPLIQHVAGYNVTVKARESSKEPPDISLDGYNAVNVGEGANIEPIPPVEALEGDGGLVITGSGVRNEISQLVILELGPPKINS